MQVFEHFWSFSPLCGTTSKHACTQRPRTRTLSSTTIYVRWGLLVFFGTGQIGDVGKWADFQASALQSHQQGQTSMRTKVVKSMFYS